MSSAETCGYLSQMAKHIERETQGRVRLNRIERDDSMFSRCSSAIFGSVVNQVDPSREEARDMKITNVYQIENIILREIFQQSVDEICRERNIDMSKSMFKVAIKCFEQFFHFISFLSFFLFSAPSFWIQAMTSLSFLPDS